MRHLLISSMIVANVWAQDPAVVLPKCQSALTACQELVQAQDAQAANLKQQVKQLESALQEQKQPLLPTWAIITISVAAGVFLGHTIIK